MTLIPGTRVGPYEIIAPLGAGGMGEVYRARDSRLGRDVAIKALPEAFAEDPERLARFTREAKLLALLSHPNVAGIHGLEEASGARYLVLELVEGESLAARLARGALPVEEALDVARKIAAGVEAAHERGVVHRDLKPGNVMLAASGGVKVLDFGLAKGGEAALAGSGPSTAAAPTLTLPVTQPGIILGTAPYMSPEQVRGKNVDRRTDIWSFGCVMYEMLTGKTAFGGDTLSDTVTAVLTRDPDWSALPPNLNVSVRSLLKRCLCKDPNDRLRDIGDARIELAIDETAFRTEAGELPAASRRPAWVSAIAALSLIAAGIAAGFLATRPLENRTRHPVAFLQKTFRRQAIFNARFTTDGRTIVFSGAAHANQSEVFVVRPEFPEASSTGLTESHLLSVSSKNELAILTRAQYITHRLFRGTLARVQLGGGAPRELLENVREADWFPDGERLAIIREAGGKDRLEYPIGKALYETAGYLSDLRISPRGDRIAFLEHPTRFDDRGGVTVIDLSGHRTSLVEGYWGEEGLAWLSGGDELVYSASRSGAPYQIFAVDLKGHVRSVLPVPGSLIIQDVSRSGAWLTTSDELPARILVHTPGASGDRDLSFLDGVWNGKISRDGRWLTFTDESEMAGPNYNACIRRTDGSPTVLLGKGVNHGISPDGLWVVATVPTRPDKLMLYPTGPGEPRRVDHGELEAYNTADWIGDGKSLFVCGNETGKAPRCYVRPVEGGEPRPVTPEGVLEGIVSPDGKEAVVIRVTDDYLLCPLEGGEPRPLPCVEKDDRLIRWSPDGKRIWLYKANRVPAPVEQLDLATGRRELLAEIGVGEGAGFLNINSISMADDPRDYAYTTWEYSSRLFLVEGAR